MNKIKLFILIILLLTNWLFLIIISTLSLLPPGFGIYFFLKLEIGKIIFSYLTSKLGILILMIIGILGLFFKKYWIYNLYMFFKGIINYLIYHYKKSLQILKSKSFSKENLKFIFNPFSGKFYCDLSSIEKKLLSEENKFLINLIEKINKYFSGLSGLEGLHVIDYKTNNSTTKIILYRPNNIESGKISKIVDEDILNGVGLSINKYILEKTVKNEVTINITEKVNNVIYNAKDYLKKFEKDKIYFGFDYMGELLSQNIDFSQAQHLGVYGTTGSGKTNFTTSLLYSLYTTNQDYNFVIADTKGDLAHFENVKRVDYARNVEDIIKLLRRVRLKMSKVNDIFGKNKVRNYKEYLQYVKDKSDYIKPTFVFIEEFSVLMDKIDDKNLKEELLSLVREIALAGRSVAFTLIFSLQVPLKTIINDSTITRMLKPISFKIEDSMNQHIFNGKIDINLDDLNIGEGVLKNSSKVYKFKAFLIDKIDLDELSVNNKKDNSFIKDEYLSYAKTIKSLSKNEALDFGLSRNEFDELSKDLQEKGIIKKTSNNSLIFTSKSE